LIEQAAHGRIAGRAGILNDPGAIDDGANVKAVQSQLSTTRLCLASGSQLFPPNSQNPGAEKNPKGVITDDRDFDEDANDRNRCDHNRRDK
jgi:hypothetical protein